MKGTLTYWTPETPASDSYRRHTIDVAVQEAPAGGITFELPREVRHAIADAEAHAEKPERVTRLTLLVRGRSLL